MKHFYIHVGGWAHAMSCYGFNKDDAWKRFKKQHGIIRMPRNTTIWESS